MDSVQETREPLSFWHKASYGVGQGAEGLKDAAFAVFLFFYYSQVLGLSGTYTGLAVGIALVFDAITDPMVGSISDNWVSKRGRRHPFLYGSMLPMALFFFLLLSPPDLSEFGLFVWMAVFMTLTRTAMTFYHVPHIALGAELTEDFHERTTIVSFRYFLRYVFMFLAYALGFFVFLKDTAEYPQGQFNVEAYSGFGLTLAVIMVACVWTSALGTRSRVPFLPRAQEKTNRIGVGKILHRTLLELRTALSNRSFRWMFVGILVMFMMVGVDASLNLYMNTFFWELQSGENFLFFAASPVGALLGSIFTRRLNEWSGKLACVVAGVVVWASLQILPVTLRLFDVFPENGSDFLVFTLIGIKFVQGIALIVSLITWNAMIPDIVDEQELVTGKRQEGIFFAASSFAGKFTTGIGTFVAGVALDLISWPRGELVRTAQDVPADTIIALGLVYGPIVAGFVVVAVWCYTKYELTEARYLEIAEQLKVTRS